MRNSHSHRFDQISMNENSQTRVFFSRTCPALYIYHVDNKQYGPVICFQNNPEPPPRVPDSVQNDAVSVNIFYTYQRTIFQQIDLHSETYIYAFSLPRPNVKRKSLYHHILYTFSTRAQIYRQFVVAIMVWQTIKLPYS